MGGGSPCFLFIPWYYNECKLGTDKVLVGTVVSGGDIGAANSPVTNNSCPVCCHCLKDWLDSSKVDTRTTLNVSIESISNVIDGLEVIESY